MVQVGNEVVHGMIHPEGKNNGDAFAKLVNAGIKGVKDIDPNIKIMIHTINSENPSNYVSTLKTNLNKVEANAANKIDVIGLSYYPKWHGNVDSLKRSLTKIAAQGYNVVVAEYADYHREVNDAVFSISDKKGIGTFVWEPEEFSGDDSKPLFDWKNNRRETNSLMNLYPKIASDFGITNVIPSSSSLISSSSKASSSSVARSSSSSKPSSSSLAASSSSSAAITPISNRSPLTANNSQTYYSLKGEPLGNAKPQKAGIYIVKQGSSFKKITVR